MSRGRLNILDFDDLDSPLTSPTSFSALGGIPGSAIAERIFNDPESWEDTSGDECDYPEDIGNDTLAWLTEEIEKIRSQSAGIGLNGGFDLGWSEKRDSKDSNLIPKREGNAGWKDIARRSGVRPISLAALFDHSNDDFSKEIQRHLSKILDSSGIKHHIGPRPLSSALSPVFTGNTMSAPGTADSISTTSSYASSGTESASPVSSHPASATLSFLEYYGVYPDSPLVEGRKSLLPRKRTVRRKTPLLKASTQRESHSSLAGTLSAASPTDTLSNAPPKRYSSVPPPGLEPQVEISSSDLMRPPPGLSNGSTSPKSSQQAEVDSLLRRFDSSPRSRPLPTAVPPLYISRVPDANSPSTPIRTLPTRASTPIRRLPSIPMEPQSQPATPPRPMEQEIHLPRTGTRHTAPPPAHLPILSSVLSPPAKTSHASSFGTVLSIGSLSPPPPAPLGARPRMRARSGDAGRSNHGASALGAMF